MRRWGKWLVLLLVIVAALYLLLATRLGLQLALAVARTYAPGEIRVARFEGSWLGPLQLQELEYRTDGQFYRIGRLHLDWRPAALLQGRLDIAELEVEGVTAELGPVVARPEPESASFTPNFSLPLAIRIRTLDIRAVEIRRSGQPLLQFDGVRLVAQGEADRLQLGSLELVLPQGRLEASGEIGLVEQASTQLALQWSAELEPLHTLSGKARLTGDWRRLQLDYALEQPAPATLQLRLQQPFDALRWQALVELPQGSPRAFSAKWPDLQLMARIEASGDLQGAELQAQLTTDAGADALYPLHVQARVRDQGDGWRLDNARLQQPDTGGELRIAGHGLYGGFSQLNLDWTDLRWPPLPATESATSPAGHLEWSGTPQAYQVQLDTGIQGGGLPATNWQLQGHGDLEQLQFDTLQVAALDGRITGQGALHWAPELRWQVSLAAEGLNPGVLQADWPGKLAAQVQLEGGMRGALLHQQLLLKRLDGTLRGYPVQGQGQLALEGETVRVQKLELRSGTAQLNLDAQLDQRWQGNWQLRIPDLAMLVPAGKGQLQGQGTLSGPREFPRVTARLQGQNLAGGELGLGALEATLDWDAARDGNWQLDLEAQELSSGTLQLASLSAGVEGTARQHRLALQAAGDGIGLQLGMRGRWQEGQWQGQVTQADWSYPLLGQWNLVQAADLSLGPAGDHLALLCWQREQSRLCLQGAGDREQGWDSEVSLAQLPLQWLAFSLPPGHRVDGNLEGRMQAHLQADGRPATGEFELALSPGQVRFGSDADQTLPYRGGQVTGQLAQDRLELALQLALAGTDRVEGGGTLSGLWGPAPRVDLRLQGDIRELALVEAFSDEVEAVQGHLRLDARLLGTLPQPALSGRLNLEQGRLILPVAGLRLEALQLALEASDAAHVDIQGSVRSGPEGQLQVSGTLELPDNGDWRLRLRAQGQQFLAVDIPEYQVRVSPDLRLDARPQQVRLDGEIEVPYARLRPRDFSGAVAPSSDVVRVGEGREPVEQSPWQIFTDVQLRLGEDVQFNGFGLRGFVGGRLALHDEPQRLTTARGVLSVRDGRYKAYGQDLKIDTGRVLYNDSLLDNPGLDIKAARHVGEITAGIRVGGQLREPEVTLYSDPALSESDTLSYLLLGRPVQQASGSEGAALMQAASAAGLGGSERLAAQIGERFGLDEVEIGGGDSFDEAALLVGKYLSPRLYVQYSVGLLEPISTFRARYEMSRRWTLQTETGTESGADVLYTLE